MITRTPTGTALLLAGLAFFFPSAVPASAGPVIELPPVPAARLVYVLENDALTIDLPAASAWILDALPVHGAAEMVGGARVYYEPQPGYFGRDRLTLQDENFATLTFEVRVLPRFQPLAGRFDPADLIAGPGLFDAGKRHLRFCSQVLSLEQPLFCKEWPILGLDPAPRLALTWPDKKKGDIPALFDPAKGSLFFLTLHEEGFIEVSEEVDLPEMAHAFPLLGDFAAAGDSALAFVFEDGLVLELQNGKWSEWPQRLEVPAGDSLLWPFRLPVASGGDAIAVVDGASGEISWLGRDALFTTFAGSQTTNRSADYRRPLSWIEAPIWPWENAPGVFFLLDEAPSYSLVTGHYDDSKPQTIPIKFPDDPPGG